MGLGLLILPAWVPQIFTANRGLERKAYRAAMKSDLRNLVTAQETYSSEQGGFTARPEDPAPRGVAYRAGPGVTVTMGIVSPTGWNAIARHEQSRETCGVRVGAASSPLDTVGAEGEPVCGRPGRRRE
jgi:hypothetical protein